MCDVFVSNTGASIENKPGNGKIERGNFLEPGKVLYEGFNCGHEYSLCPFDPLKKVRSFFFAYDN